MNSSGASGDWSGLARNGRLQLADWIAEKSLFAVSLSAVGLLLLIFVFIGRESIPVFFMEAADGQTSGANLFFRQIMPLAAGCLKVGLTALVFAAPTAIGAALYISQLASPQARKWGKPLIETLSGVPSVVLGSLAAVALADGLQYLLGTPTRLNALTAGIALGLAVIPLIFSIAEDALSSVPSSFRRAAFALGSSKWQAAFFVVLPAALPGVFAAVILGFGRAVGETMIVLLAAGEVGVLSWSLLDSSRGIAAEIAAELPSVVFGGLHCRVLFALGGGLFAVTCVVNFLGGWILSRLERRLEAAKPL